MSLVHCGPITDVLAQWRLMTEFFCSVETVDRMFLRFPFPVKTDKSLVWSKLMIGSPSSVRADEHMVKLGLLGKR